MTWLLAAHSASAHDVSLTAIDAYFQSDGSFSITVHYDADAWLVGVRPEHVTRAEREAFFKQPEETRARREAEFRDFIKRRIKLRFDDEPQPYEVAIVPPTLRPDRVAHADTIPGRVVELKGRIEPPPESFEISCSRIFGNVILSLHCGAQPVVIQRLDRGGRSDPFLLDFGRDPDNPAGFQGGAAVLREFVKLGFEHILPLGIDHILFVLGLFLLSKKWPALLWQVTAFTVAHSITLSLAVLGVIRMTPEAIGGVIEPLIAASIVFVAVENIFTSRLHAWRPIVVFIFGLLHGLGFASVLMELGLPAGRYVAALAGFNIGVEIGQLAVLGLAFLAVGWWRDRSWYRKAIVIPASGLIAAVGVYWVVERVFFA